jgi:hypothetical protein
MAKTDLSDVQEQIQKYWSPVFTAELRASLMLGSLVDRTYQGTIKKGGDTVSVSQVDYVPGETRTVGVDADTYSPRKVVTQSIDIKADKRFIASAKFEDLVDLQSQIDTEGSDIRNALMYGMQEQINNYLYGLVAASAATPDHIINAVADLNATQLSNLRILAGQAKWPKFAPWYILCDPVYYMDVGTDGTLTDSSFNAGDPVVVAGETATKRYGFNILEDNALSTDHALCFFPQFMHFVTQTEARVKISDLHSNEEFGFVISVDLIGGAKLGISGDVKHIQVYNSAWAPV